MKSDQMGTGHNNPSPRELPLSNQARFKCAWVRTETASRSPVSSRITPTHRSISARSEAVMGKALAETVLLGGGLPDLVIVGGLAIAPPMSSAIQRAKASASKSELLARRLAPCSPVEATSPQAHKPGTVLRPRPSTLIPPMWSGPLPCRGGAGAGAVR